MSLDNPLHLRAVRAATEHLPGYLGAWIAGTLGQAHTIPALVQHQDRIAYDVLTLARRLKADTGERFNLDEVAAEFGVDLEGQ